MSKTKSTKAKKEVKETQKLTSFFKKVASKNDDDFQRKIKDSVEPSTSSSSSTSTHIEKTDSRNAQNKTEPSKNKLKIAQNVIDDSDDDFVETHLETFKNKHKFLYDIKSGAQKKTRKTKKDVEELKNVEDAFSAKIDPTKSSLEPRKIAQRAQKQVKTSEDVKKTHEDAEKDLLQELAQLPDEKPKTVLKKTLESSKKAVSETHSKYFSVSSISSSNKDLELDSFHIPENNSKYFSISSPKKGLDLLESPTSPHRLVTVETPEKTYLQRDILQEITNVEPKNIEAKNIEGLLQDVNFVQSSRKCSPPHSTPIESKKRKTLGDEEVIPGTPEEEVKTRRKSSSRVLVHSTIEEEHVVPDMIVRSPPIKYRKISEDTRKVINLGDLSQKEFKKIYNTQFKGKVPEYIRPEDLESEKTYSNPQESTSKPIKTLHSPSKESSEPITALKTAPTIQQTSSGPITAVDSPSLIQLVKPRTSQPISGLSPPREPIRTTAGPITSQDSPTMQLTRCRDVISPTVPQQTTAGPIRRLSPTKEPIRTSAGPITSQDSTTMQLTRCRRVISPTVPQQSTAGPISTTPKKKTANRKSSPLKKLDENKKQSVLSDYISEFSSGGEEKALSTSNFFVSPSKNMSPSKWSPMRGSKGTPSKSSRSPIKRSLDFGKNQPKIDGYVTKSPVKQNDTLLEYFKNLPSSCEEKKGVEIDSSNFVCTRKCDSENLAELNFDDSWGDSIVENLDTLSLEDWQYCKVLEVSIDIYQNLIINVESIQTKEKTSCILNGIWRNAKLKKGDRVNVIAVKSNSVIPFTVGNDSGFVVYEPDFLISGTSIVGSLFCKRRGVLSDKFRGVDPGNSSMIIGSLVHQLLQDVLTRKLSGNSEIEKLLMEILNGKEILRTSYASDVSISEIRVNTMPFVPKIVEFVRRYVSDSKLARDENWCGKIEEISDIEENIWCSKLGIKGKVDVTVKTNRKTKHNPKMSILPLELKTGRASFSLEHRGQVILYTMMMTDLGYDVNSGLLLYLRENIMREVESKHKEKRDLIMLRNELAYYLKQQPKLPKDPDCDSEGSKISSKMSVMSEEHPNRQLTFVELPEPISHHSACKKCPYSTICTAFLSREKDFELKPSHPLADISKTVLEYLKPSHVDYFIHWASLIQLESNYKPPIKELKDIWRLPALKREARGKSVAYLTLIGPVVEKNEPFIHHFKRSTDPSIVKMISDEKLKFEVNSSGLTVGSYAVVSTDTRVAIAAGFVSKINKHELAIGLERNLTERYANNVFHIDTYESQTIFNYSMGSIATLLENSSKAKRLREVIIEKQTPEFAAKLSRSIAVAGMSVLKRLNKIQQRAVLKSLTAQDYLLIKGMPGTGKTATIVALIQLLVKLGKSVLITSHTNSAVDNVCLRLVDCGVELLRLGAESRVHPLLKHCLDTVKTSHCKTIEELDAVYNSAQVVAVTCLGANHPLLTKRVLDVCVVDESTQVLQCSVFKPLQSAKTFILIGDPDQLPPVVSNPEAVSRGMNESLFERLHTPESTITLTLQYRMNKTITALANILTYKGQLLCADDTIAYAILRLPKSERLVNKFAGEQWVTSVLDSHINHSVIGIDTGATWKQLYEKGKCDPLEDMKIPVQNVQEDEERVFENIFEAAIVATIIEGLKEGGLQNDAIGVIAPYRAQVGLLRKILTKDEDSEKTSDFVEVNTVDQYQGRDKDVIIYSCTKSRDISKTKTKASFEILEDKRRLTVAITRAKHKLIIIGDFCTLKTYSPFEILLNNLEPHQVMSVAYEQKGFSWKKVMERVKKFDT